MNKHKLKSINEWLKEEDIGIFIETGINEDNEPIKLHDQYRTVRHNAQINKDNS